MIDILLCKSHNLSRFSTLNKYLSHCKSLNDDLYLFFLINSDNSRINEIKSYFEQNYSDLVNYPFDEIEGYMFTYSNEKEKNLLLDLSYLFSCMKLVRTSENLKFQVKGKDFYPFTNLIEKRNDVIHIVGFICPYFGYNAKFTINANSIYLSYTSLSNKEFKYRVRIEIEEPIKISSSNPFDVISLSTTESDMKCLDMEFYCTKPILFDSPLYLSDMIEVNMLDYPYYVKVLNTKSERIFN